jgi:hypothetical protein
VKHVEIMRGKTARERKTRANHSECQNKSKKIALPTVSPRIERLHHQVLDLQDKYHSAQKIVNQLTRELQLCTNKPEYQRLCQAIRKELCDKIDDTVWKQKNYERDNERLQKMVDRHTFTRVERAFGATSTSGDQSEDGNAYNISLSFDQGHAPNLPAKLSTKEKLR